MASQRVLILLVLVLLFPIATLSLTCSTQKLSINNHYQNCEDLPTLNSYLHWSYSPSNHSLSIAFLSPPPSPSGWVAWALNPTSSSMSGSQALIASPSPVDASISVDTYNIKSYGSIVKGDLEDFQVSDKSADYSNGFITIYATLSLPPSLSSSINHVWQVGPSITNGVPAPHDFKPANLKSIGSLSLSLSSSSSSDGHKHLDAGIDKRTKAKYVHGILNGLSWGILFPVGVVIARYLRTLESADPAWFYLHVSCQILGYALGVAGWATGMKLGSGSKGVVYSTHRAIGIALFCFATLQVFAGMARPNKDHKYRFLWNIYHRGVGYAIVLLGIINVFQGIGILQPDKKWKHGYVIFVVVLGCVSVVLEVVTWVVVILRGRRKPKSTSTELP